MSKREESSLSGDELARIHSEAAIIIEACRSMQRRGIRLRRAVSPVYVEVAEGEEKLTALDRAILAANGHIINIHIAFCAAEVCPCPDEHRPTWYYRSLLGLPEYQAYAWSYYCAECERQSGKD